MFTAIGVVPQWLRLLYWPAHLSSEYGPPDAEIAQGVSVCSFPALSCSWDRRARRRCCDGASRSSALALPSACVALLPSSNFLLPAGIVFAERTLFCRARRDARRRWAVAAIADGPGAALRSTPGADPRAAELALVLIAGA